MTLEELKKAVDDPKTDPKSKVFGKYLLEKCGESEEYSKKVQQEGYSLQRCMSYICYRAAKLNTKHETMLAFLDDEVFGWADDYFNLDQDQEKMIIKEASILMVQLNVLHRNGNHFEGGKTIAPFDKNKTSKDTVPTEEGKTGPEAVNGKEKKKTGDKSLEGQISLFDMIEEGF